MLHSRDVENWENTAATLVGKGGIEKKGRTYCVTGEPNDVSYKNNTDIPDISIHYFPKDVALCPKWTCFDRRHRGDFTLQCRRLYAFYRLRRRLLRTHITSQIRGTQPMNSAEKNADWGVCSHTEHDCSTFFSHTFYKRRMVSSSLLFMSRAWDVLILLVFLHDHICASLIVWKSYQL